MRGTSIKNCTICAKEYVCENSREDNKYCSLECRNKGISKTHCIRGHLLSATRKLCGDGKYRCHECIKIRDRASKKEYNKTQKGKDKNKNKSLKENFGITLEDFNSMLKAQYYKCGLCLKENTNKRNFHVDHDHETSEVRALLCHHCNMMLGYARDNPETLRKGADYVEYHKQQNTM